MAKYSIGIYIRLSLADIDLSRKEGKTESESITNQRALINRYLDKHEEFEGCPREEFFDDGYSGTSFARPSFEKMMEKVKKGKINLIAVKDFSRFGRDYIELGDYLERIFPFLGVRFISVNDNYDSDDYKGTTGGMDVVLKNIVYDYYSKDLSDKVTTSKYAIMKRGVYQGGHVPFGLRKSAVKGKLETDPEAAQVVRKVFDLAISGKGTGEIARALNSDGDFTPSDYFKKKNPQAKKFKLKTERKEWSSIMVLNIIRQEMYYGAIVQHKRQRITVGSKHTAVVPKEEQFIVENQHEGIVTKEEWTAAQAAIRPIRKRTTYNKRDYPLRGVARCACCHRMIQYFGKVKRPYFTCEVTKHDANSKCFHGKVFEDELNEVVWQSLQSMFALSDDLSGKLNQQKKLLGNETESIKSDLEKLQKELKRIESDKYSNMDKYMSGDLPKEKFLSKKQKLDEASSALTAEIAELGNKLEVIRTSEVPETEKLVGEMKKYSKESQLTSGMVQTFIESVEITDDQHAQIIWKFSDIFKRFMEEQ